MQILTQLKWFLSRSGSDREVGEYQNKDGEAQLPSPRGQRGKLSVDVFVTSLLMAEDLFHIQKPGSYITPCPQSLSTRIAGLLYSLWLKRIKCFVHNFESTHLKWKKTRCCKVPHSEAGRRQPWDPFSPHPYYKSIISSFTDSTIRRCGD